MREARVASKAAYARRRAEKREAAKARKAAERATTLAVEKARKAAERTAAKAAPRKPRRPVDRPPKLPPRPARWTDYRPEFAREIYHAIRSSAVDPDRHSLGAFFDQHINTIMEWRRRHQVFDRAIARGAEDRDRWFGAIISCRRVEYDSSRVNDKAKTLRGAFKQVVATAKVSLDRERYENARASGHLTAHLRRRWYDPEAWHWTPALALATPHPGEAARCAILDGALTGRAIAKELHVAESTLRHWRKQHPDFDQTICDGIANYQERRDERAAEAMEVARAKCESAERQAREAEAQIAWEAWQAARHRAEIEAQQRRDDFLAGRFEPPRCQPSKRRTRAMRRNRQSKIAY